jgi:hypothetical protein
MKTYSDLEEALPLLITNANVLLSTLKTVSQTIRIRKLWNKRMDNILSSPSYQRFEFYIRSVEEQLRIREMVENDLIKIRTAVKEVQFVRATCQMYTIGKGLISIKDGRKSVADKVAQRKPKKQVRVETQTQFIMSVCDDENMDEVIDNVIDPELRGITLGDPVRNPFTKQESYIRF